ncbi:MAG: hypothetical protein IPL71_22590 [Anaerolineales bacterium]|uniref:hypothetical protein n=1 Tax=Candidatus Villigracilis proximus TaxID=3140683 RepID=UPI003135253B|nr:hypothetical protein [Anaerolineales bacterium]
MDEKNDLFGKKHATLWRISMWANGLASIVLFIYVLLAFGQISQYTTMAHNMYQTDLIGLFSRSPLYILDVLLQMTKEFLQGAFYYLALKGISLGLDMIVETDINYREKKIEGGTA